ncbi:hypothetical protein [Oceanihabitans sediminis]|uniref:hypothetical protein n=1 Tax=Oceanihabitans sediminis TaxID=1812012 RepID=UPI00299D4AF4|nr:hypothetical protein [Oceanihabitans sediminis]MDX1279365.1 hypothetical protein [Oceanihabitans sediminis]
MRKAYVVVPVLDTVYNMDGVPYDHAETLIPLSEATQEQIDTCDRVIVDKKGAIVKTITIEELMKIDEALGKKTSFEKLMEANLQ